MIRWLLLAALFSFSSVCAEDNGLTKEEIWNTMAYDVDHWVDKLGFPIDQEIKEVVIALNVLGITTVQSCEGHLDRALPFPWVDIEYRTDEVQSLIDKISVIKEQLIVEESRLRSIYPDLDFQFWFEIPEAEYYRELHSEYTSLRIKEDELLIQMMEKVNSYLNEFYETYHSNYDKTIVNPAYSFRLQSVGALRQFTRTEEERQLKLIEYRNEMNAFAAFLKNKFMSENS